MIAISRLPRQTSLVRCPVRFHNCGCLGVLCRAQVGLADHSSIGLGDDGAGWSFVQYASYLGSSTGSSLSMLSAGSP